ncbi:molybdopterin molybdotransferase MoeA [Corynebacterium breve]|uniref:Molybdopterin molybdenumtransferase n=1 Tax=Corynebacterium breve TaxID=3049799 RepID=A0ABY8VDZ5_9CORY|nr:molybdopterin molybdotransferase MoeA [Corynebacterium breve]WIM67884.1 molybdopterin molybdotransferase MoeA [Corynebacterium breve]
MARTPEQHLAEIRRHLGTRPTTTMGLIDAARYQATAAQDVVAEFASPRFDNSQMDGYALSVLQVGATPGQFRVGPTIPAGTDPDYVYPNGITNAIVPIMTGAKLPRGTAGIVPIEDCQPAFFSEEGAFIQVPVMQPGQFMRTTGSDIQAGDVVVKAGTRVTPAVVATLASQGCGGLEVYRPGRIVTVTGGAEIGVNGAAAIPDANEPMLEALAHRYGIDVVSHVRTDDDPARLKSDLENIVAEYAPDAIVTSGGISHGKYEVVRQVLERSGWFGHVDQQPGGPQGLSTIAHTPVISLPGNPISTLVSFRLFVAPVLGHAPKPFEAKLTEGRRGLLDRDQFLRGRLIHDSGSVLAAPVGGTESHLISQAVPADCLIRIPQTATIPSGGRVEVYPL